MMIKKHILQCDTCSGIYVPPERWARSAKDTRTAAREVSGWVLVDLLDVCPSCQRDPRRKAA